MKTNTPQSTHMIDKIKYALKLSSIAFATFIKLYVLGSLNLVVSFIVGLIWLLKSLHAPNAAAHVTGEGLIMIAITTRPVQCLLLALNFVSVYFMAVTISRYTVKKVIHRIVKDKSESVIYPMLDRVLQKVKAKQPGVVRSAADFALIKLQLVQRVRDESENKWLKKALIFVLDKLSVNDIDLNGEGVDVYEIIKIKALAALHSTTQPEKTGFWIVLGIQWLCALIVIFTA